VAVSYEPILLGHDACDDDLADTVSDAMLNDCELGEASSAAMDECDGCAVPHRPKTRIGHHNREH